MLRARKKLGPNNRGRPRNRGGVIFVSFLLVTIGLFLAIGTSLEEITVTSSSETLISLANDPREKSSPGSDVSSRKRQQTLQTNDENCPFRNSKIYRKVYVYPNVGDIEGGWSGRILSEEGKKGEVVRWPWLDYEELARQNEAGHFDIRGQQVQYTTEFLVREILINPNSCLRTFDPEEADLFWVPYMPSMEHHRGKRNVNDVDMSMSPYANAIRKIIDKQDYSDWEMLFGLTSEYWKRRSGSDHILVFSEPMHGLWHPKSKRGSYHYVNDQKQLSSPIIVSVELSTSFVQEYPNCARKNILVPYPNTNGDWYNGNLDRLAREKLNVSNVTVVASQAALPAEKELSLDGDTMSRPIAHYYNAGNHGSCKQLRREMSAEYSACSPSSKMINSLNAKDFNYGLRMSTFCAAPGGDSPSAKRNFDSIIAGCIPLVLSADFVWPFTKEFDAELSLDPADFSVRFDAKDHSKPLLDHKTCQLLNASQPSLDLKLEKMTKDDLKGLRRGVERMAEAYSWYRKRDDGTFPANPLKENILPDGGLAHLFVDALGDRAKGARWPACRDELKQPHKPHPTKFKC